MWRSRRHIGNAKGITFVKDRMVTTSKIHATELGIPAVGNRSTCSIHATRCDVAIRALPAMPQLKDLGATADVPQLSDYVFHRKGKKVSDIQKVWTSSYRAVGIQPRTKIRKGKKIAGPGARA
jgi:hypothetical protein